MLRIRNETKNKKKTTNDDNDDDVVDRSRHCRRHHSIPLISFGCVLNIIIYNLY